MKVLHNNNINALRFIAAFMVIFSHSFVLVNNELPLIFGISVGGVAVDIFFVLSGYLIAKSWSRDENILRYFLRRFLRIFPALFVIVLLTIFVLGPLTSNLSPEAYFANPDVYKYLLNAILIRNDYLPGVFENNPYPNAINGSLWTLTIEACMYLLLPIIYSIGSKIHKRKIVMIATTIALISLYAFFLAIGFLDKYSGPIALTIYWCTSLGSFFFIGACFFEWRLEGKIDIQWSVFSLLLLMTFSGINLPLAPLVLVILIPSAILPFAICQSPILSNIFKRDDFSYGLYIYAFPIQQSIITLFLPTLIPPPSLIPTIRNDCFRICLFIVAFCRKENASLG